MSIISAADKKHMAAIRRQRELAAGGRPRSTRINNRKGKGSYSRTTKYRSDGS